MRTKLSMIGLGFVSIVALVPLASAHPFGTPIDNPLNGRRCYYFDDHDSNTRQLWLETNGVMERGEAEAQEWFGLPPIFGEPGSGLQRFETTAPDGSVIPPDTLLDPLDAIQICFF